MTNFELRKAKELLDIIFADIEPIAEIVHKQWIETKQSLGVTSRKSETQEELMQPYSLLSDAAQNLDRGTVKAVARAVNKRIEAIIKAQAEEEFTL